MFNKHNLAIAALNKNEDVNRGYAGLRVTPTETIVTDGKILLKVSAPAMPIVEYPMIEGFTAATKTVQLETVQGELAEHEETSVSFEPFTMPSKDAVDISKAIPKTRIPILSHAVIGVAPNGSVPIAVTDLDSPKIFSVKKSELKYPNVDAVIPSKESATFAISLNLDLLIPLLTQMAAIGKGRSPNYAVFRFTDHESQVRIDLESSENQAALGVIMPVHLEDEDKTPSQRESDYQRRVK